MDPGRVKGRAKQAAEGRAELHSGCLATGGKDAPFPPQYYMERVWDVGNTHSMDVLGRKLLNFNKLSGAHINCETKVIVLFG